ncbi:ectoine/hydroxyectoine ABC transporter substrate-binding protein EhuB [Janibacter sp. G349]|uniref:ectoine/hydroxyectoine ABC transporter substrate-binding protein EhuB n=1 Tax=unclassified Janibacter TaxID=2649294 RepID=UPI0020CC0A55|nr:ectoine/hydroxyectoine ABC transporter substrate-binding protein EhuB [Janibacter sp. CX7]UTT66473.1 ectoine/hydroxyectoine ABC transporter substrate-binding protein EhuB [Janibacter sp. CX7]
MRHTKTLAGTAALTLALTLAACGDSESDSSSGDKLSELKDKGTITVAFAGEEPYSFEKDGELTGATIALHKKIFKDMGIEEVKGVKTEWNALIPGLKAGRYDAISAGMSILPDRCKEASFGDPEILYTTALMVPEGNPKNLKNLDDVKKSGAKLATMSGAIETDYAKSLDIEATQVKTPQDGMDAVARGSSDVFALTGISLRTMDENNPDVKVEVTDSFVAVVDGKEQVGAGATVFKKGDDTLRDAYNKELAKITGDEKAYTDVIGEFGFTDAERPKGDLTTEQLCKGELPDAK